MTKLAIVSDGGQVIDIPATRMHPGRLGRMVERHGLHRQDHHYPDRKLQEKVEPKLQAVLQKAGVFGEVSIRGIRQLNATTVSHPDVSKSSLKDRRNMMVQAGNIHYALKEVSYSCNPTYIGNGFRWDSPRVKLAEDRSKLQF